MKTTLGEKNGLGLEEVLANYAESIPEPLSLGEPVLNEVKELWELR